MCTSRGGIDARVIHSLCGGVSRETLQVVWPEWAAKAPRERAEVLQTFGRALLASGDELFRIEVADTGNTVNPMRMDIRVAVESLNYYGGLVYELKGDTIPGAAGTIHHGGLVLASNGLMVRARTIAVSPSAASRIVELGARKGLKNFTVTPRLRRSIS